MDTHKEENFPVMEKGLLPNMKTKELFLSSTATNTSVCAICDLRHVTSRSMHWCPECEEALCTKCSEHHSLSKETRSHKTIPISQYQALPNFVTDIQQFCLYHNGKYQQYCMKHECPICYKCIKEHGKCTEVFPLEDVISGVKSSELLRDLEQSLEDVLENIKRIREDREANVKSIQTQKKKITMEIDNIKTQINQRLDKLKDSVIKELEQIYNDYNGRIQSIISSIKDQQHEIEHCSTDFENITKFASDLQTFLGMREIQSKVTDNESRLKSLIENKSLENVDMQLTIDDKIQDFLKLMEKFGSIIIRESPSICTNISSKKTRQAQILAPHRMQLINNISVEFHQKLNTMSDYDNYNEKLVAINANGKNEFTFKLSNPYSAYDLELINDNIVAVRTGEAYELGQYTGISVVDLTKRKVIKFIELPGVPYGIKHDGTSLICCVKDKDLHVISCTDYSITSISNTVSLRLSRIAIYVDRIFYTSPLQHTVVLLFIRWNTSMGVS
ncbi:unnamed protein product [Mytilus coruscus]|uniref:B box-type domain-containing protein n=1 Tax=Mytilus coruscus TaxID=42192 RepID=A0A6J8CT00_MYTCO|nr:unnamed protein product [Mytilus coruscus]